MSRTKDCISSLDPLIARWDIDLSTFDMEIALNEGLVPGEPKRFAFVEKGIDGPHEDEPGFTEFLQDASLSGDVSDEEVEFLRRLRFKNKRPNGLYNSVLAMRRSPYMDVLIGTCGAFYLSNCDLGLGKKTTK